MEKESGNEFDDILDDLDGLNLTKLMEELNETIDN